ncbi:MAG: hypothetical protein ABMA26_25810 [Limisphaerales bacterium]
MAGIIGKAAAGRHSPKWLVCAGSDMPGQNAAGRATNSSNDYGKILHSGTAGVANRELQP